MNLYELVMAVIAVAALIVWALAIWLILHDRPRRRGRSDDRSQS